MAPVTSKRMGKKSAQVKQSKFVFDFGTKTDDEMRRCENCWEARERIWQKWLP